MNAANLKEETIRCFARKVSEIQDEATLKHLYHWVKKMDAGELLHAQAKQKAGEQGSFETLLEKMA